MYIGTRALIRAHLIRSLCSFSWSFLQLNALANDLVCRPILLLAVLAAKKVPYEKCTRIASSKIQEAHLDDTLTMLHTVLLIQPFPSR